MLEERYILIGIHRMVKELDRETARIAGAHGLTLPQFMVLEALLYRDGMTVGEIKEKVLSSNGTISVVISNLEKQGMVRREKDPEDHRRSIVELTAEGRAVIREICPENDEMFREKFSVWSREEKKLLVELLNKYRKNSKIPENTGKEK